MTSEERRRLEVEDVIRAVSLPFLKVSWQVKPLSYSCGDINKTYIDGCTTIDGGGHKFDNHDGYCNTCGMWQGEYLQHGCPTCEEVTKQLTMDTKTPKSEETWRDRPSML